MSDEQTPVQRQLARSKRAWQKRATWDPYLEDAFRYCLPHRSFDGGEKKIDNDLIFDMTATQAVAYAASNLKSDMMPVGQSRLELQPGPVFKSRFNKGELREFERRLERVGNEIDPFFQIPSFDNRLEETFHDVMISTGAILPVKGTHNDPLFYANIPIEQLAPMGDGWGRLSFLSWRQKMSYEQIKDGFPNGKYNKNFNEKLKAKPDEKTTFYQDWFRNPNGTWSYVAYTEDCDQFIATEVTRTQPVALIPYSTGPGEIMGRGPVMMAMPTIKTLNKVQELGLRSAAMQLLGVWAYRTGGTFNPDTARLGAGEFWPMMSTGGVLGPDVQRLDQASGRIDVARMVIEGMRDDLKQALFGDQLPTDQGTPASASEILARMQRQSRNNLIAYGRISSHTMPVLVPRVAEILSDFGYLSMSFEFNEFFMNVKVRSPLQRAMDSGQLQGSLSWLDVVQAIVGPERVDEYVDAPELIDDARRVLDVPRDVVVTDAKRRKIQKDKQDQTALLAGLQAADSLAGAVDNQPEGVA